jgi:plasmid stabilization system protein ParE
MSRKLIIRPRAKVDLADAALWYEQQRAGLGDEFLAAVKARLAGVADRPASFPVKHRSDIRRALVDRFPYGIWFVDATHAVVVLGIFHTSRDYLRLLRRRR